jgi:hypothetical protein
VSRKPRWKVFSETELERCKRGFDDGDERAFWDAILLCEQTNTPKPPWLRDGLERYAMDRINNVPLAKKAGRPATSSQDLGTFEMVEYLRRYKGVFGRKVQAAGNKMQEPGPKARARQMSKNRAFEELERQLREYYGEHVSVASIRAGYERARNRMRAGPNPYLGSPFKVLPDDEVR